MDFVRPLFNYLFLGTAMLAVGATIASADDSKPKYEGAIAVLSAPGPVAKSVFVLESPRNTMAFTTFYRAVSSSDLKCRDFDGLFIVLGPDDPMSATTQDADSCAEN